MMHNSVIMEHSSGDILKFQKLMSYIWKGNFRNFTKGTMYIMEHLGQEILIS